MKTIRRYSELRQLPTYDERLRYLELSGRVGADTFGFDRVFNQKFYKSKEWQDIRNYVIVRDTGVNDYCCDLGIVERPIAGQIFIHHMNPISMDDIEKATEFLLNPDYLIAVSLDTHNRIHYGMHENDLPPIVDERKPNDTCPWKG